MNMNTLKACSRASPFQTLLKYFKITDGFKLWLTYFYFKNNFEWVSINADEAKRRFRTGVFFIKHLRYYWTVVSYHQGRIRNLCIEREFKLKTFLQCWISIINTKLNNIILWTGGTLVTCPQCPTPGSTLDYHNYF